MARIELVSPFSQAECVRRLQERSGDRLCPYTSVIGSIGEKSFWLEQKIGYRNSFQTRLRAAFAEEASRTRIHCRIGIQPLVAGFMIVWLVGVTFGLISSRFSPHVLAMLLLGGGIVAFGRFAARNEQSFLIEFLCSSLHAREYDNLASKTFEPRPS
jgi:hypothetical protein